jgi:alkanesulfonate monooxygenase SsuD/methylene tetrahydromethanopterin reductase-like flavin-dependent oxidoreductase (luciferase family)
LIDWARVAEAAGFSILATLGRLAWPAYEELVTLAAAAGATHSITLSTNVLLGPTRDPVLLAVQAATLDQVSGGRFVLGIGVGSREDDFSVADALFSDRGRRLDAALTLMHAVWQGKPVRNSPGPVGPRPALGQRVPMLFPGHTDAGLRRAARFGVGLAQGSARPHTLLDVRARLESKWGEQQRADRPIFRASTYFVVRGREAAAEEFVRAHYHVYPPGFADGIWAKTLRGAAQVEDAIAEYAQYGWDELILIPAVAELDQVEELAEFAHG